MGRSCVVPKCKTDYRRGKQKQKVSIFKVPSDIKTLQRWAAAIPGLVELKSSHYICEKHFEEKCIIRKYVKHDASGKIIAEAPFQRPRLSDSAVPTIFGKVRQSPIKHELDDVDMTPTTIIEEIPSTPAEAEDAQLDTSSSLKQEEEEDHQIVEEIIIPVALPEAKAFSWEPQSPTDGRFEVPTMIINERLAQDPIDDENKYWAVIPKSWSVIELCKGPKQKVLFSYARVITKNGVQSPVIQKCVTLYNNKELHYHIFGRLVNVEEPQLPQNIDTIDELPNILIEFERMKVCSGIGSVNVYHLEVGQVFQDYFDQMHHNNCTLMSRTKRSINCMSLRKVQLQKEIRSKRDLADHRIYTSSNPVENAKLMAMRTKYNTMKRNNNRAKERITFLLQSLNEKREELRVLRQKMVGIQR